MIKLESYKAQGGIMHDYGFKMIGMCRIHQDAMVPQCNCEKEQVMGPLEQTFLNSKGPILDNTF